MALFKNCIVRLAIVVTCFFFVGCRSKEGINDAYKDFRGKTSAEIFNSAQKSLAKKHYDDAVKKLEALDAIYPFGVYSRQGQLNLIYAYYMSRKMPSAMATSARYIRLYPRGPATDYAYYMRGLSALQQEGGWLSRKLGLKPSGADMSYVRSAYADMSAIYRFFPASKYVSSAKFYMAATRAVLADHQLGVAQFYYDHHAYLAAANRARSVVLHFQGTPEVIPSLLLMVKSYRKLHLDTQASQAYRVLRLNAPNVADKLRL